MSDDLKKNLNFVLSVTRGIIRDQQLRRKVLGGVLGTALAMVLIGACLIDRWLSGHILLFLLYWGACAWFTVLALLMALFEILMVKAASRADLKRAQRECRPPPRKR